MSRFVPKPEDHFTFGLWTVGNRGRDPFGHEVRPAVPPVRLVQLLSEVGAYGVNFHDNDLIPIDATPQERDAIVAEFKQAVNDCNMRVPMVTVNLFSDPVFRDGAFTSNVRSIREYALRKTIESIDLAAELGAEIFVLWGGREGTEVDASKDPRDALKRYRECIDFLCEYVIDHQYPLKFALEAKPNEPRGDLYLPTTGSMLAFIETLAHPDMVGVNPEFAHETMAGLNMYHQVAQALEAGKLFHIDLNDQKIGRFDQDLRFGSESLKGAFFLVKLLEDAGWQGMRHFDAHAYRTEDEEGVKAFAEGCIRNYLILREKVHQFNEDPEIQAILQELRAEGGDEPLVYSADAAAALKDRTFDRVSLGEKAYPYEKLDQLVVELLLGVR
ncbi:xylose isomerase [Alicyclobacillus macrosporangiidus]|uniref:Xylose isomerase n=1 Tax=Alicyclobacillus macrosporangiidus TaxID=392015 RepID=A0A1I7GAD0_9BACL|nr:xylose isomerase [Alicyclobacillus macrosporangiidus]SFU45437.1 xylose isomerase [Alicyclobacillus macrosporangiidus]